MPGSARVGLSAAASARASRDAAQLLDADWLPIADAHASAIFASRDHLADGGEPEGEQCAGQLRRRRRPTARCDYRQSWPLFITSSAGLAAWIEKADSETPVSTTGLGWCVGRTGPLLRSGQDLPLFAVLDSSLVSDDTPQATVAIVIYARCCYVRAICTCTIVGLTKSYHD